MGNIIAEKKGRQPAKTRLLLNAHMDEVGLLVTSITEEGLLRFTTVGGIDRRILPGKSRAGGREGARGNRRQAHPYAGQFRPGPRRFPWTT